MCKQSLGNPCILFLVHEWENPGTFCLELFDTLSLALASQPFLALACTFLQAPAKLEDYDSLQILIHIVRKFWNKKKDGGLSSKQPKTNLLTLVAVVTLLLVDCGAFLFVLPVNHGLVDLKQ